jgi:glycosyltransferase involved in cell wall biosynthesis
MPANYVILTAAKDEEAYIGDVIRLVVRQTVKPLAWFIMDDGSSDRTAAIVESFAAEYPFIHLQSAGARGGRNFGSQYKAVMAAYDLAKSLEFDFVCVQDADQGPEREDYYERMLHEFKRIPKLGMASGYVYERWRGTWECRQGNSEDAVTGGMAFFRRIAFDGIGGYTPLRYGGSDTLAQLELERAGWEILTRPELHIYHYRPTCSAGGIWRGLFRAGFEDASLGYHPVFEIVRCLRRLLYRPILGSMVRFFGYLWWKASGRKPLLGAETLAFVRKRQMIKLRRWVLPMGKRPGKSSSGVGVSTNV